MKKLIFQAIFFASFTAFSAEQEVQFIYYGTEEDYEAYYACSYASDQADIYLKSMGATDIKIDCKGGLRGPYDWHDPLKLVASFNYAPLSQEVEIKSDHLFTACAMNTRMIKEFVKVIPGVSILEKRDKCGHPRNPFYFKLLINR